MALFRKVLLSWIFWYSFFSVGLLVVAFYLVLGKGVEPTFTKQILNHESTIARAEVANLTTFFTRVGNSVATLAQLSSIESSDSNVASDLGAYTEQWRNSGFIGGVILTDKNGAVKFNSNILGISDTGTSLADREYFIQAKATGERGKYFISQPVTSRLGASEGQAIVVVASPVYKNNQFSGIVAVSVILQPVLENFLGLMRISDQTKVYLVDGNGTLLYNNTDPTTVSSDISGAFSDDTVLSDKIKSSLGATEEGQFQTGKYLVAYHPVILETQNWLLVISSPFAEVENLARPAYIRLASLLMTTIMTILLLGVIVAIKKNHS